MKVKDLKALLESYDDDSEIEIEIYDAATDICIDSYPSNNRPVYPEPGKYDLMVVLI